MALFVISMISKEKISDAESSIIKEILTDKFDNNINVSRFDYDDQDFKEIDFDLLDFSFTKEDIHDKVSKLINVFELMFQRINKDFDIIASLNDNDSIIQNHKFDIDEMNHLHGMLATRKKHSTIKSYYSSPDMNVYIDWNDSIWLFGINL